MLIRPCLSGTASSAPEKKVRMKPRPDLLLIGRSMTRADSCSKTSGGQTTRQFS